MFRKLLTATTTEYSFSIEKMKKRHFNFQSGYDIGEFEFIES